MMTVTRLEGGAVSVSGGEQFEEFSAELLASIQANDSHHIAYDGETVVISAVEGTIRYRRISSPDERGLCRMERVA